MSFVVKDLCATEWRFIVGEGLETLADLRKALHRLTGVEKYFMRFVSAGRSHSEDHPDECLIKDMFSSATVDTDAPYEDIVWWLWMSDDHFASLGRGGFFLESELPRKQAWHQRAFNTPLRYVTFRQYRDDPRRRRLAASKCAKRNKLRTPHMEANCRSEQGLRALSSDDEVDAGAEDSD